MEFSSTMFRNLKHREIKKPTLIEETLHFLVRKQFARVTALKVLLYLTASQQWSLSCFSESFVNLMMFYTNKTKTGF